MKKLKAFGLLVIVLALSLAFIACGDGDGSNTGAKGDNTFQNKVYSGKKGNDTYSLNISRGSQTSKAYISSGDWTPANGDAYKLVIALGSGVNKTSEGTVTSFSGGVLTLASSGSSFTVKVGGSTISEIKGAIPITSSSDNNTAPLTGPGSLISSSSGGGGSLSGGIKPPTQTAQVLTFTSGDYEIIITEKLSTSRAAYEPKDGDTYIIKKGGVVISQGTVTRGAVTETGEITLVFTPTNPHTPDYTFTATLGSGVLEFDSAITDDNGVQQNIPPLFDQNNEYGHANSEPPLNTANKTIAGINYKSSEENSWTESLDGNHYLINSTFEAALNLLKNEWGNPGVSSWEADWFVSISAGSDLSWKIETGEKTGVLFEVSTHTNIYADGEEGEYTHYRLAEWVQATLGSGEYGEWKVALWDSWNITPPAENTPNKTIGVLTYTEKDDLSRGPTLNEDTAYLLNSTYEAALAKLKALWGDPRTYPWYGHSIEDEILQANSDAVVFVVYKETEADGTWSDFVLYKYIAANRQVSMGVGWHYEP